MCWGAQPYELSNYDLHNGHRKPGRESRQQVNHTHRASATHNGSTPALRRPPTKPMFFTTLGILPTRTRTPPQTLPSSLNCSNSNNSVINNHFSTYFASTISEIPMSLNHTGLVLPAYSGPTVNHGSNNYLRGSQHHPEAVRIRSPSPPRPRRQWSIARKPVFDVQQSP